MPHYIVGVPPLNRRYRSQNVFETAFEADRLSAAFSGEGSHAGLAGVCGNLPDCDNCELSLECHWYAAEGNSEKMAIEEKIQRNKTSAPGSYTTATGINTNNWSADH